MSVRAYQWDLNWELSDRSWSATPIDNSNYYPNRSLLHLLYGLIAQQLKFTNQCHSDKSWCLFYFFIVVKKHSDKIFVTKPSYPSLNFCVKFYFLLNSFFLSFKFSLLLLILKFQVFPSSFNWVCTSLSFVLIMAAWMKLLIKDQIKLHTMSITKDIKNLAPLLDLSRNKISNKIALFSYIRN